MADLESGLAFEDIVQIVEPQKKPRTTGATEVRSPADSLAAISSHVDKLGPLSGQRQVDLRNAVPSAAREGARSSIRARGNVQ